MKRIISLAWVAMVMSSLVLASALPAFAATPTFLASCSYTDHGVGVLTNDPQDYRAVNTFYRDCQDNGGAASRDITPNPGAPTQ